MKEPSFMIVIPRNEEDMENPGSFLGNLTDNELISVKDMHFDEERGMVVRFEIEGAEYEAVLNPEEVEIPNMVRPEHAFSDEEYQMLDERCSLIFSQFWTVLPRSSFQASGYLLLQSRRPCLPPDIYLPFRLYPTAAKRSGSTRTDLSAAASMNSRY